MLFSKERRKKFSKEDLEALPNFISAKRSEMNDWDKMVSILSGSTQYRNFMAVRQIDRS